MVVQKRPNCGPAICTWRIMACCFMVWILVIPWGIPQHAFVNMGFHRMIFPTNNSSTVRGWIPWWNPFQRSPWSAGVDIPGRWPQANRAYIPMGFSHDVLYQLSQRSRDFLHIPEMSRIFRIDFSWDFHQMSDKFHRFFPGKFPPEVWAPGTKSPSSRRSPAGTKSWPPPLKRRDFWGEIHERRDFFFFHMLHGAGIFTNICPKNHPNVSKYTIHGASGFRKRYRVYDSSYVCL